MSLQQGAVYWVQLDSTRIPHPHVIVYVDTPQPHQVVICAITTNQRKISLPANILLEVGEADLPKQSIIEVSKHFIIHQSQLGDYIGQLSPRRVEQIIAGMRFLRASFFD
jgi:mRNA interferase MazF